jgi:hypothetical protein
MVNEGVTAYLARSRAHESRGVAVCVMEMSVVRAPVRITWE